MLTLSVTRALLLGSTALFSTAAFAQEQARLTINEDAYNVPIGKPFAVRIDGKRMTLRIDRQTDRVFDQSDVSFNYPTDFEPLQDEAGSEGVTIWTLQGRNAAVMLQRYEDGLDPKSLLEVLVGNLLEREGNATAKQQAVKLTGPDRAYQGVQVRSSTQAAAGQPATKSVQNFFTFANENGVFALLIQDVSAPGAKESKEYTEALRLLGESLKTGKEPEAKP